MPAALPQWLAPGKKTSVKKLATYFGPVSFTIEGTDKGFRANIDPPLGNWQRIALSLRHPIKEVTVNGEKIQTFNPSGEIMIPHRSGLITIEALN